MPLEPAHLTVEEFLALPDDEENDAIYELIDGVPVPKELSPVKNAVLGPYLLLHLFNAVRANNLGGILMGADGAFRLDDYNVGVPDASYVAATSLARMPHNSYIVPFAPDLAVEIKSPTQTADFMREHAEWLMGFGTKLVWVIDYEDQRISIYHPGQPTIELDDENETLNGEDILPGLTIRLGDLFAFIIGVL